MEKFVILCRYESWTDKGKEWGKWYVRDPKPRTLEQALQKIESLKASSAETVRITKLKYGFKTLSVKEYEKYKSGLLSINGTIMEVLYLMLPFFA